MFSIPVLILAYAREANVITLISQIAGRLSNNIYLCIDGAKNSATAFVQRGLISKSYEIASNAGAKLTVWHRDSNLGVGVSVPRGIDWFFANEFEGVILEDDLEISDDLFRFISENIELVRSGSRIAMLSGSRYFEDFYPGQAVFSGYPMIWGWATNRNRWNSLRLAYKAPVFLPRLIPVDSKEGFWSVGSFKAKVGLIDTWDLPLVESMIRNNAYCLLPPTNLVTNIGVDEFAVHTTKQQFPLGVRRKDLPKFYKVDLSEIEEIARGYDSLMDKLVYGIRARHLLSPAKLRIQLCKNQNKNFGNLWERIERTPLPHGG